LKILAA